MLKIINPNNGRETVYTSAELRREARIQAKLTKRRLMSWSILVAGSAVILRIECEPVAGQPALLHVAL